MPLDLTRAGSLALSFRFPNLVAIFLILPSPLNLSFLNVAFYIYFQFCLSAFVYKVYLGMLRVSSSNDLKVRREGSFGIASLIFEFRVEEKKPDHFAAKYWREHPYSLQYQYSISYLDDQILASGVHYFGLFTCAINNCGGINMKELEIRQWAVVGVYSTTFLWILNLCFQCSIPPSPPKPRHHFVQCFLHPCSMVCVSCPRPPSMFPHPATSATESLNLSRHHDVHEDHRPRCREKEACHHGHESDFRCSLRSPPTID